MRIALLSDIHANLEALNACIAHARDNGATRFAFLGDLVGYGADPRAVVDIVARHVAEGALAVKGNHDEAMARRRDTSTTRRGPRSTGRARTWTPSRSAFSRRCR